VTPELKTLVTCEEALLSERGFILTYPATRFRSGTIAVFSELKHVRAGSTIWFLLIGPDREEADVSSGELVLQNMPYLQCSHTLGGLDLAIGPYRVQVLVDKLVVGEKDVMLGVD
jgi:hypothetical protein